MGVGGSNIPTVSEQWDYFLLPTVLHENNLITSLPTVHLQTSNLKPCHDSWAQEGPGVPIPREPVHADIAHQVVPVSVNGQASRSRALHSLLPQECRRRCMCPRTGTGRQPGWQHRTPDGASWPDAQSLSSQDKQNKCKSQSISLSLGSGPQPSTSTAPGTLSKIQWGGPCY